MATARTSTRRPRVKRTEFVNKTQGFLGAIKINRKGDDESLPVAPGERVFLTEEEIELTEQAHAHAKDSPFFPREITHYDPHTLDPVEKFVSAPLARVEQHTAA